MRDVVDNSLSELLNENGGSAPDAEGRADGVKDVEAVNDMDGGVFPQHTIASLPRTAHDHVSPAETETKPPLCGARLTCP